MHKTVLIKNNVGHTILLHIGSNTYLLTYLIGSNNPITDFDLPQHIFPGASAFCVPTLLGYTNRRKVFLDLVLPKDTRSSSLPISQIPASNTCLAEASTVVEEHIQLTIESNAEIIAISHWTEDFT